MNCTPVPGRSFLFGFAPLERSPNAVQEVPSAALKHGLLSIRLQRPEPANVICRIPARSGEVQPVGGKNEDKDNKGGSYEPR